MIIALIISSVLTIIIVWIVLQFILGSLYSVIRFVGNIEFKGGVSTRLEINSSDEIGLLQEKINDMVNTIENFHKKEVENAAIRKEMEIAAKIQTALLPNNLTHKELDISAKMITADSVGGDYYDIIKAEGRDWLVIGDVSGHGVYAGLIMMMVQTAIHTVISQNPLTNPKDLINIINRVIKENITKLGDDKYMTITVFAYIENGEFYFSGMHLPIMIFREKENKVEVIDTTGMWLGIMKDISNLTVEDSFNMNKGDVLLLYTDGVTESWDNNINNKMYSQEKLEKILMKYGRDNSKKLLDSIVMSLTDYKMDDDVTILVVKKL